MRIVVTGSSGNVGSAIVTYVLAQGHTTLGLDIAEPSEGIRKQHGHRFTFQHIDMTDYAAVKAALQNCEAVIHTAALPTVGKSPAHVIHNTNVVSSYNCLVAAAELGIKRVVQLSSVNAIGACYTPYYLKFDYLPLDEQHRFLGADPYALSKQVCEIQAVQINRAFPETRICSIRPHACLEQPPSIPESPESLLKYGRTYSWDSQINVNDVLGWSLMTSVAEACYLGITSEGWSGAETFYIVAPTNNVFEKLGEDAPGSLTLAQGHYPDAKLKDGWFGDDQERRGRGFYDCSKAERLLGWKHP